MQLCRPFKLSGILVKISCVSHNLTWPSFHSLFTGEFIVLELLRLQKIDMSDLQCLKALFDEIDDSGDGIIDMFELQKHNLAAGRNLTPRDTSGRDSGSYERPSYGAVNKTDGDVPLTRRDEGTGTEEDSSLKASTSEKAEVDLAAHLSIDSLRAEMARVRSDRSTNSQQDNKQHDDDTEGDVEMGVSGSHKEEDAAPTMSDMYNSMVIPVIQHLNSTRLGFASDAPIVSSPVKERRPYSWDARQDLLLKQRRNSTSDIEVLSALSPTTPGRVVLAREKKALLLSRHNTDSSNDASERVRRNTVTSAEDEVTGARNIDISWTTSGREAARAAEREAMVHSPATSGEHVHLLDKTRRVKSNK